MAVPRVPRTITRDFTAAVLVQHCHFAIKGRLSQRCTLCGLSRIFTRGCPLGHVGRLTERADGGPPECGLWSARASEVARNSQRSLPHCVRRAISPHAGRVPAECDAIYSESRRGHAVANRDGVYAALPAALQYRPHIPRLKIVVVASISCATARPMNSVGTARPSTRPSAQHAQAVAGRRHMQGMRVCAGTYHSALM